LYFPDNVENDLVPKSKGHLNPGSSGVDFDRFELGADLSDLVRHVWVVRWAVPEGEVRPQRVLTYPALNAVIEPGLAALYGPDSRVQVQELRGTSWAVGVLFRPAAGPLLATTDSVALVSSSEPLPAAPAGPVQRIMTDIAYDRCELGKILRAWLLPVAADVDDRGRLVNKACRLAESDPGLTRAADLAARLGVSPRSLERLVRSHIGMTPKWLIECRRLQHAATTLFASPDTDLSALAAELEYTDYPHFSRQYRRALGESPKATRERGRQAREFEDTTETAGKALVQTVPFSSDAGVRHRRAAKVDSTTAVHGVTTPASLRRGRRNLTG
jgi:AraC-like DNA-binding protein